MYVLLIVVCPFVLFLLAIVLSVLLRYTDSDWPFDIFKLFLIYRVKCTVIHSLQYIKKKNIELGRRSYVMKVINNNSKTNTILIYI